MKQLFILSFLLFCASHLFGQKEANIWYFGNKAGLDFNSGAPVPITDGEMILFSKSLVKTHWLTKSGINIIQTYVSRKGYNLVMILF